MTDVVIGLYSRFSCIADKCPHNCCTGWKISIDDRSYSRFTSLKDPDLREDILSNICEDQNGSQKHFFRLRDDGRCAMLDDDGLCRIQRNYDEGMLCFTCRKYPRLVKKKGRYILISLSASCPVVAHYLVNDTLDYTFENRSIFSKAGHLKVTDTARELFWTVKPVLEEVLECTDPVHKMVLEKFAENYFFYRYLDNADWDSADRIVAASAADEIEKIILYCIETSVDGYAFSTYDLEKSVYIRYRSFSHVKHHYGITENK